MKTRALAGEGEGVWLRAERQTGGKGRLGRKWESPPGNLYCSSIVEIGDASQPASTLSFAVALAVYDLLDSQLAGAKSIQLKWPNDVLVDQCKICGVLLESVDGKVIVGIGINVAFHPDLPDRKTTSIHHANAENKSSAGEVLRALIPLFDKRLEQWRREGLSSILADWQARAHPIGTALTVSVDQHNRIEGKFAGLTASGALKLEKADGSLVELHAGDVEAR